VTLSPGGSEDALAQTRLAVDELKATMVHASLFLVKSNDAAFR
jgi:hypothetical protein